MVEKALKEIVIVKTDLHRLRSRVIEDVEKGQVKIVCVDDCCYDEAINQVVHLRIMNLARWN